MSGRKPMSSIRSASSSTAMRISSRRRVPPAMWSRIRPGVPTITSAPRRRSCGLLAQGLAAVEGDDARVSARGQLDAFVADLDGQLAGRGQDQGLGMRRLVAGVQPLEDRDREGGRLARPGPGLAHHVHALHRPGNQPGLDGGGLRVLGLVQGPEHGRRQRQVAEGRGGGGIARLLSFSQSQRFFPRVGRHDQSKPAFAQRIYDKYIPRRGLCQESLVRHPYAPAGQALARASSLIARRSSFPEPNSGMASTLVEAVGRGDPQRRQALLGQAAADLLGRQVQPGVQHDQALAFLAVGHGR